MPVSEEFKDEIEAINSIYGGGTLVLLDNTETHEKSDGAVAVLALPASTDDVADTAEGPPTASHRLSLRLHFPRTYPSGSEPPAVLGVQSAGNTGGGHRRPGAAARDVEKFRAAIAATFQEGQVCMFDAVEEFLRQMAADDEEREAEENQDEGAESIEATEPRRRQSPPPSLLTSPPPWTIAEAVVELKSTFLARCAPVTSPAQAAAYVQHLLASDRRIRSATHNMTAWRIRQEPAEGSTAAVVFQDCDDDGETAAGGRLLHLMQLMDLWNVMVVVTRWYGGHKLGPRRFALINQAAREAFVKAGLVTEPTKKKGHGK